MNKDEVIVRELLINKWMIPAYIFLGVAFLILFLEAFGIIKNVAVIGVVIAMNLFLAGVIIPLLIQIYGKLSEISIKIG
jgi:hypothetical protein